ncbi:ATP-binding protein [Arthrobacter sp. HY1533]|uniref:ATP-binding protein n=1 Tax=Arthrobacter sp. HY1533 TaxID=2970919 RepID=UPI0022B9FB77|nr:ATP-binding protein [Arthrobacter sp. HY1533]
MSTREQWLAANDDFLSTRLAWLRGRLQALADGTRHAPGRDPAGDPAPDAGPPAPGPDLPLARLAAAFGLNGFETDIVFLCAAMELDTGMGGLCAAAQHDDGRGHPTFALAMQLFDDPAWDAMSPDGPLRHWPLVNVGAQVPLTVARLTADERVVNFIKGLNHLDWRLGSLLAPVPAPGALPPSQAETAVRICALVQSARPVQEFLLAGSSRSSKELVAATVARAFGLELFRLDAEALAGGQPDSVPLARLWHREVLLNAVALFIDAADAGPAGQQLVRRWLSESGGLVFVAVHEPWPRAETLSVDVARPTAAEQATAWGAGLDAGGAAALASHFDLDLPAIADTLARAAASPGGPGPTVPGDASQEFSAVWAAALDAARPALDQLAHRVPAKARLAQLKLPDPEMGLLREIVGQVARRGTVYNDYGFAARLNRGTGISVLFAGESGTGKTMAAEALAAELGLLLYKIDLSAVVSKYIGETEKNLRSLFDAAESGGAVLFFDEADALFGKRSEVRDSHDRYANIEVSYLLQRMESFNGLAVLASNRKDSVDPAFLRRLRFVVNFPFPAQAQRRSIWQEAFPAETPVGGLDLDRLARLNLTGGSIHNVALNAAFLAANDGGLVTMELMLAAARSEYRKLERPINDADFAWTPGEVRHGH